MSNLQFLITFRVITASVQHVCVVLQLCILGSIWWTSSTTNEYR